MAGAFLTVAAGTVLAGCSPAARGSAAAASTRTSHVIPFSGKTAGLILKYQGGGRLPVPRVPGTTQVDVPLYADSHATHHRLPLGMMAPTPGTPYVRLGKTSIFQVAKSSSTVTAWIERQFSSHGLRTVSHGSSGGPSGQESLMAFASSVNSPLVYNLTTYAVSPGVTRYAYFVSDVVNPSRPASTKLPVDLVRMTGTMTVRGASQRVQSTNKPALSHLARIINAYKIVDIGFHCPLVVDTARLTLYSTTGKRFQVDIASGCSVAINGTGFQDYPPKPLWSAVLAAASSR